MHRFRFASILCVLGIAVLVPGAVLPGTSGPLLAAQTPRSALLPGFSAATAESQAVCEARFLELVAVTPWANVTRLQERVVRRRERSWTVANTQIV